MTVKNEQPRDEHGRFSSFTPESPMSKKDMAEATVKATPADYLTRSLKMRAKMRQDFVPLYRPSDNFWGTGTGTDQRASLDDLLALMNLRVGPGKFVTDHMSADAVRNWHIFVDPDSRKPIKNDHTKAMYKWAIKSDLRNQFHQLVRYGRGIGTSFLLGYWTKDDKGKMDIAPPNMPPRKFKAYSPRFMTPINLNQTNELDYNEDVWRFSGGIYAAYNIHQDRIHPLILDPEEGDWRGWSVFESCLLSITGYMQSFIYIVKAFRQWGEIVPVWFTGESLKPIDVANKYLDLLDQYEMAYKFVLGKEDKFQFVQTQIGKGIHEAMEQFKEDMSSCWRVPLNQLFGRSVGGGLEGAGALVSKEDYLQEVSNIQMRCTDDALKIYENAGWDVESYDLEWLIAIKKTDEQKLREEGMELQNKILEQQLKQFKLQNKMMKMQMEYQQQQPQIPAQIQQPELLPEVIEGEEAEQVPSDFTKRYWNSLKIDNHIYFPYGDKRNG